MWKGTWWRTLEASGRLNLGINTMNSASIRQPLGVVPAPVSDGSNFLVVTKRNVRRRTRERKGLVKLLGTSCAPATTFKS